MKTLVAKYEEKLIQAGLAEDTGPNRPIIGGLDHTLVWNRDSKEIKVLKTLFDRMAINSLVFFRPKPPYDSILEFLTDQALQACEPICPMDCETRTFLHDLPVVDELSTSKIVKALGQRKSVIIADKNKNGPAVIAHGTVSPEQGFVVASSVAFAGFVKFFTDYLSALQTDRASTEMHRLFDNLLPYLEAEPKPLPDLMKGPFKSEEEIYSAMVQAGKKTVEYGLVDSYFGNISYCRDNILYISQTGSSLDELSGCIDPVPLDGSSSAGLTASSELTAHVETIAQTQVQAILHGHPKFSVILSMDCDPDERANCKFQTKCHILCPKDRQINQIPIVPGEVGTGPTGLCHTLPKAFAQAPGVIVYGHGLFTLGKEDFSQAFATLLDIENQCRQTYLNKVKQLRKY